MFFAVQFAVDMNETKENVRRQWLNVQLEPQLFEIGREEAVRLQYERSGDDESAISLVHPNYSSMIDRFFLKELALLIVFGILLSVLLSPRLRVAGTIVLAIGVELNRTRPQGLFLTEVHCWWRSGSAASRRILWRYQPLTLATGCSFGKNSEKSARIMDVRGLRYRAWMPSLRVSRRTRLRLIGAPLGLY